MEFIKKALLTLAIIALTGCSLGDDEEKYHYEVLPIESIVFPDEFVLGEVYTIDFTYLQPTSCHGYYNIYINAENENRTLAVTSIVFNDNNCEQLTQNNEVLQSFDFKVLYDQTYRFHIWKGVDDLGEDIYEVIEVPTIN